MSGPGHDHELLFAVELREHPPIQLNDLEVVPADDEQRGRPARETIASTASGRSAAATSAAAAAPK
jgi:hypothetical protein